MSSNAPAAMIGRMFGCCSLTVNSISRLKRATVAGLVRSGGRTFTTTFRLRSSCVARKRRLIPPPSIAVSAPAVVLAAASQRTKRIRLTSAVSVLSSDDPVRVFQEFSTLDLLSDGRAEIMAGRGSFIESFPLFGYDLNDYDTLFAEKLDLLLAVREAELVTWPGGHRPAIDGRGVYPRPLQDPLPVWVAVGGSPQSAIRAGALGLPMALAIIGGLPERFTPFADLHRRAPQAARHGRLPVSINSHGFIAEDSQEALDGS